MALTAHPFSFTPDAGSAVSAFFSLSADTDVISSADSVSVSDTVAESSKVPSYVQAGQKIFGTLRVFMVR